MVNKKEYIKKWNEEHKEHNKQYFKKYNKERHKKLINNPELKRKRKETRKEADKKYRENRTEEQKEEKKKYDKKCWQKNKNDTEYKRKRKEYAREWGKENIDRLRKGHQKYRKEHQELFKRYGRKRRARENNIIEDFSNKEWLQKLKDTFGVCPRCNKYFGIHKLTLDHIHPISKATQGQIYTIDDVQPLCRNCNAKKHNIIEKNMEAK